MTDRLVNVLFPGFYDLKTTVQEQADEISELQEDIEALSSERDSLQQIIDKHNDYKISLEKEIIEYKITITKLNEENLNLKNKNITLTANIKALELNNQNLSSNLSHSETEFKDLEKKFDDIKKFDQIQQKIENDESYTIFEPLVIYFDIIKEFKQYSNEENYFLLKKEILRYIKDQINFMRYELKKFIDERINDLNEDIHYIKNEIENEEVKMKSKPKLYKPEDIAKTLKRRNNLIVSKQNEIVSWEKIIDSFVSDSMWNKERK
jgi:chromosome segregation ATPase